MSKDATSALQWTLVVLFSVIVAGLGLGFGREGQTTPATEEGQGSSASPVYSREAKYKIKVIPNVRVRMSDGVELAAKIIRPDAEGQFPAIMSYSPYHGLRSRHLPPFSAPEYLVERGYVIVQFDVRGTDNSGGSSPDMYSDKERRDGYDMIEWIASQPWCDGNVGMWGSSYGGVDTWQVAVQNPPHLKAVIINSGTEDVYTEWTYPGGVLRPYMFDNYVPMMTAENFSPPDIDLVGEKWESTWMEHLKNNVPWGMGFIEHMFDGTYWRDRSARPDYDRIKCPVFLVEGWPDWYATPMLRGFTYLKVPKRVLIGPWGHYWAESKNTLPGPRIDGRPEYLKWFDQWLKGIDTGLQHESPVTIFVEQYKAPAPVAIEENGFWRNENEWPLSRAQDTSMYFHPDGKLSQQPYTAVKDGHDDYEYKAGVGMTSGREIYVPFAMPVDQRLDEAYSLTYTAPPLQKDTEVTGNPTADIYISSTADVAYFTVKVCDVAPDGTSKRVSEGALNATHRESHSNPTPLKPGEVYELKIDLKSLAYIFPAGHRIRVDVTSADFQNAWPVGKKAVNSVHHGSMYESRVILPFAAEQNPKLPPPQLAPAPYPAPTLEELTKPTYVVTHDEVNQTTTFTMERGPSHSSFTVSDTNPAEAVDRGTYEYTAEDRAGLVIKVAAQSVLSSDETSYRYLSEVEVTVNGKLHFHKSWTKLFPRQLN